MMRVALFLIISIICFVDTGLVFASGFHLKSIGNVETGGRQLSHWWYSGTKPVFHGEATPGAEVVVDIDGKPLAINADSSGNWDFQPEPLSEGDHQINISSDGSTISFTLSIGTGNVDWSAVESGNKETMPAAGTSWPTVLIMGLGLGVGVWSGKILLHVKN